MDEEQERAIKALRRAVKRCQDAGLFIVANVDIPGIVIVTKEEAQACDDLRTLEGKDIRLSDACGGMDTKGNCSSMTMPM